MWFCVTQNMMAEEYVNSEQREYRKAKFEDNHIPLESNQDVLINNSKLNMSIHILSLPEYRVYTLDEIEDMYDQYLKSCLFIFDRAINQIHTLDYFDPDPEHEYLLHFHNTTHRSNEYYMSNKHMQTMLQENIPVIIKYSDLYANIPVLRRQYVNYCNAYWEKFLYEYQLHVKNTIENNNFSEISADQSAKKNIEATCVKTQSFEGLTLILSVSSGKKKQYTYNDISKVDIAILALTLVFYAAIWYIMQTLM